MRHTSTFMLKFKIRNSTLLILALLILLGCENSQSSVPKMGSLHLFNDGNTSVLGPCQQQFSFQSTLGGEKKFAHVGPCEMEGFMLPEGNYNVTSCVPSGACSKSDCATETLSITDNSTTNYRKKCHSCSACPP